MTKGSKKRKQGTDAVAIVCKKPKNDISNVITVSSSSTMIGGLIFPDELETTTETLNTLASNPSLITLKALKPFKTAVHDYWRVAHEASNTGNSLTSRISSALTDCRHIDALVFLSEMSIRGQIPKLGALQRWVRECDAVLTPGTVTQEEENRVWQVLDMILRTTQPELISVSSGEEEGICLKPGTRLRWYPPFSAPQDPVLREGSPLDSEKVAEGALKALTPLQTTPGAARRPPNKHPLVIYYSPPSTFPLLPDSERTRLPKRHDLPGVPGAFIINDVLEVSECCSLVAAAEKVGLLPDEPVGGSAKQLASVLAHNLVWLADENFIETLYQRIVDLLPQEVNGGKVRGINRRFRLYRYRPGALYRPHIDGAWPASSLSLSPTPGYIYDSDPEVYSRLTLLIYLNDGFTGGCTTFFLPSATQGILEARPVQPRAGAVAVFPHGAAKGSLLHEGSGVIEGAKYVIRTEVLYEVDKSERIDAA